MIRKVVLIVGLCLTTPSPASVKPCRDRSGKVIKCPKPESSAKRCRDANGKFVPCSTAKPNGSSTN